MARGVWSPRIEHPDQVELEVAIAEATARAEAKAAAEAARHAIGGNGAPPDEPTTPDQGIEPTPPVKPEAVDPVGLLPELEPTYSKLHAMYEPIFGHLWHGKAIGELGVETERTIRRWRNGEMAPGKEDMGKARDHMLDIAIKALMGIGETELAAPVIARREALQSAAAQRAVEMQAKNFAVADAKKAVAAAKEAARLARFEAWWKADGVRRAKIAAETVAHPRFFVSLAKPPKGAPEAVSLAKPPRVAENA